MKMKVIIGTHGFSESIYKVGSFHIAKNLSNFGHSVLSISLPVSPFHIIKIRCPEIRKKFKLVRKKVYRTNFGFYEYIPFSCIPLSRNLIFGKNIVKNFHKVIYPPIRTLLKQNGFTEVDILILEHSRFLFLEEIIKRKKFIYRITDIYPYILENKQLYRLEQEFLNKADKIIVTSLGIKEFIERNFKLDKEIAVIENGVDVDFFVKTKKILEPQLVELMKKYKYRIIYVGAIDYRIDIELLAFIATNLKEESYGIFLFGLFDKKIRKKLGNISNIHFMGPINYQFLPSLLKQADVGILPFKKIKENDGRSPMKLYEYGICGLPVVSTNVRSIVLKREKFVLISDNYKSFVRNIRKAIKNKKILGKIAFSSSLKQDWKEKVKEILNVIGEI